MIDNSKVTDYNYMEVLDRNYTDVPNKSFVPTKKKEEILNTDFMEASKNFWLSYEGGKYFPIYNEGVMNGTYNTRQPTFKVISETILEAFKNILRIQCEEEDKTLEEFSLYLDMLDKTFNLISNKIDSSLDNKIKGELILGYLHAVFNSFITVNIKNKGQSNDN